MALVDSIATNLAGGRPDVLPAAKSKVIPQQITDNFHARLASTLGGAKEKEDPDAASDQPITRQSLPAATKAFKEKGPQLPLIKTAIGTYKGLSQADPIAEGKDIISGIAKTITGFMDSAPTGSETEEVSPGGTTKGQAAASLGAASLAMTGGFASAAVGGFERDALMANPGIALKSSTVLNPDKSIIKATSDDLYRLKNWVTADKAELAQHLDQMPPEFKTAEMQEKFYHKLENPKDVLSPGEQAAFDKWISPMREEIQKLSQAAGKYGMPMEDNEWVHRVMKGKEADLPVDASGAADIPQLGTRKLPRKTSAMMPRSLYVLEAEDGRRAVVSSPKPGLLTVWNKGKGQTVKWGDDLELGNPIMVAGKKFVVKQAKTGELEADTPYRFQKSAAVNLGDALVKMRATVRNIQYLDNLTKSPGWNAWATKNVAKAPRDWVTPKIPQLKDWRVHPKMAGPFDDFFSGNLEDHGYLEPLRAANRWAVGTLFWNPTPHIENVAGHWFVGRGFDWLRPTGWYSLFADGARALKEVRALGNDYKDMLKHGNALISGGVRNADFYRVLGRKFGLEVEQHPERWEAMARNMGLSSPIELSRAWYAGVNRVLWQANDVFMMQRVFELERKGMSRLDAIKEAEKHIPNYRVPPEVLKSRMFSKLMQDPAVTSFGRYHYGVWNSYTNMVRDMLGKDATPQERFEAVGNMMALGGLVFGVYPAVSWALEELTGDKKISKIVRGPAAIPTTIWKAMTDGEKQWYDVIGQSITIAPATRELIEQVSGHDLFTGQHIDEPGEKSIVRRAAQRVEHGAETMVAPYSQLNQASKALDEKGIPRQVLDQVIGAQDRTAQQEKARQQAQKIQRRQAKARRKRPRGLIEEYGGAME